MAAVAISACCGNRIERTVDSIYGRMSEKERIAQLHGAYLGDFFDQDGRLDTALCAERLSNGVGHFSQFAVSESKSAEELRDMVAQMQEWLMKNTPCGIPALFHEEVLSGVATRGATVYPQQIGLACSFNTGLAELKTWQTAEDLRNMGGALALSPMVDVVRNPHFNRLEESYGEDAYLSAAMGCAFVRGLQHGDLKKGVAACSKHFLGYGGGGDAGTQELMEEILLPHEAIIRTAGSKVLMTGYHSVHGVNAVASSELQREILRDYLEFDGMTVSDYGSIDQIDSEPDRTHRAAAALRAGNDVEFPSGVNYPYLAEAVGEGLVSAGDVEAAVKNVLRMKARLGLLDRKPRLYAEGPVEFDTPDRRKTAYELASQSVVLLENDGILPLKDGIRIALCGPNAASMWAMLGDYSFHGMRYFWQSHEEDALHPVIVTLKDGLEGRIPEGTIITYSRGCDWTEQVETVIEDGGDARSEYMKSIQDRKVDSRETADERQALEYAAESDVIIAAMGENVMLCGENRDRLHLRLPGRQEEFVEKLIATGKPVVLIMFGGRAQVISGIAERCAAVIQAWYPGEEGGNALADILYGRVSPSGKLSVSYPAVELNEPVCYCCGEQTDSRIAYPFGYGLSYSSFEYSDLEMARECSTDNDDIRLSFSVRNTGKMRADEIVQIYLCPVSPDQGLRPRKLQGFGRVSLEPGESRKMEFSISAQQFGRYADKSWEVAPGEFIIKVGASSDDIRLQQLISLTGEKRVMKLRSRYFTENL